MLEATGTILFTGSILRSPVNNPGPSPKLAEALAKNFGSVDAFKAKFREAGLTDFGSGWSWLVRLPDGTLTVYASHNQDNPLMDISEVQGVPLLACDVWEHAYYLNTLIAATSTWIISGTWLIGSRWKNPLIKNRFY